MSYSQPYVPQQDIYTSSYIILRRGEETPYKPHNGIEITFPPLPKESQGRTIRCNKVYTGSCNFDGSNTAKSAPYSTPYRCKPCTRKLWRWKRILTIANNKHGRIHTWNSRGSYILPCWTGRTFAIYRETGYNGSRTITFPRRRGEEEKKKFENSVRRLVNSCLYCRHSVYCCNRIWYLLSYTLAIQCVREIDFMDRVFFFHFFPFF